MTRPALDPVAAADIAAADRWEDDGPLPEPQNQPRAQGERRPTRGEAALFAAVFEPDTGASRP